MDLTRTAVTVDPRRMRPRGCFTCRYDGAPIGDPYDPLGDHRLRCSRPRTWPANIPKDGCCGWARDRGAMTSDDTMHHMTRPLTRGGCLVWAIALCLTAPRAVPRCVVALKSRRD